MDKVTKELISACLLISGFGGILLLAELYYTNYYLIVALGINIPWLDTHLFAKEQMIFLNNSFTLRPIIAASCAIFLLYPNRERTRTLLHHVTVTLIAAGVFFVLPLLKYLPAPNYAGQIVNILGSGLLFFTMLRGAFNIAPYLSTYNPSLDKNIDEADGFPQTTQLIETPTSVNLKYTFRYKGHIYDGYINALNIFRANAVIGLPGSGKSYAIIEEYIRQCVFKGFCGVVYDYKDPALTQLLYSYLCQYKEANPDKQVPRFAYLSSRFLNRTYRCNPLKGIATASEAQDIADVILTALNKSFLEKQGEFFTESAKKYTALNIYALGVLKKGTRLSLPHLISLLSRPAAEVFPALKLVSVIYPDMRGIFSPFQQAFEQNVMEQLQGQLASAQIGVGSMSDRELAYIMTEDEEHPEHNITVDINNPDDPLWLALGNDPKKDRVLGLACSVYLSRMATIVNQPKRIPCLFAVDEYTTTYVSGSDKLIATARSNKIAVLLGYQDNAQLVRDYGQKVADALIGTSTNVFSGMAKGETARKLSESFGEKRVLKQSKTMNEQGSITVNYSEQKEKRVPQNVIEELSQGDFVGRVADEYKKELRLEHKVFHGTIQVDNSYKKITHTIPDLRNWSERDTLEYTSRNLIRIDNEISALLAEIKPIVTDYKGLVSMTMLEHKPKNVSYLTLEECLQGDMEMQPDFLNWLEKAYYVVYSLEELDLKNDVLSFQEKFELLFRDVWKGGEEEVRRVMKIVADERLISIQSVQQKRNELLQSFQNVADNYDLPD